jgi:erythronate-4-phosphate dehydrogenase
LKSPLRIVCDENVAVTPALLGLNPHLTRLPGRSISQTDLQNADALLVRSVTQVDAALIENTPVKFVGTATAGMDHIDCDALLAAGITVCSAPGANANAVVEWVLAALAHTRVLSDLMSGATLGIVGLGHVGTRLAQRMRQLGARIIAYDPLRDDAWPTDIRRGSLADVLGQEVVSLHAALHRDPPHPSYHLIHRDNLPKHAPRLLLNAGRGQLVTREALMAFHRQGTVLALDTWPDEPEIDPELLNASTIATPHIAGYSSAAKARATDMLVEALIDCFQLPAPVVEQTSEDRAADAFATLSDDPKIAVSGWLEAHYPIEKDDRALRTIGSDDGIAAADFDRMRRDYALRPELTERTVRLEPYQSHLRPLAEALGMRPVFKGVNNE